LLCDFLAFFVGNIYGGEIAIGDERDRFKMSVVIGRAGFDFEAFAKTMQELFNLLELGALRAVEEDKVGFPPLVAVAFKSRHVCLDVEG
jgi:hypothetical protein